MSTRAPVSWGFGIAPTVVIVSSVHSNPYPIEVPSPSE